MYLLSSVLITTIIISSPARAREITLRGDGWFETGNSRFGRLPMREVKLRIEDTGDYSATLMVRGAQYTVRGRLEGQDRLGVERLSVAEALGGEAVGSGRLSYRDGRQPTRLELDARTREGVLRAEIGENEVRDFSRAIELEEELVGRGLLRASSVRDGRLVGLRARVRGADVRLEYSGSTRGVLRGEVLSARGNRITARVTELGGRRASGDVELVLTRASTVDRVYGAGSSDDGSWQLDFTAVERRYEESDRWSERDRTIVVRGAGWLRQDRGPDLRFERMEVMLDDTRSATIDLIGRRTTLRLMGRWRASGSGVRVDLSQVNEMPARGRLELARAGWEYNRLEGSGRTALGDFEVAFAR